MINKGKQAHHHHGSELSDSGESCYHVYNQWNDDEKHSNSECLQRIKDLDEVKIRLKLIHANMLEEQVDNFTIENKIRIQQAMSMMQSIQIKKDEIKRFLNKNEVGTGGKDLLSKSLTSKLNTALTR